MSKSRKVPLPVVVVLLLGTGVTACGGLRMVRAPAQPTQNFPREWGATEEEPVALPETQLPPPTFDNVGD